ncbi:MAG: hypothetical protein Q9201_004493 [Fulgogasparrea decipioides]
MDPGKDGLPDKANFDAAYREWQLLQHYRAALDLNRLFLNGERPCTFYHGRRLEEESDELVPGLLRLHDHGLLTIGSQPFRRQPERLEQGGRGYWYQLRQRPFLQFLIPQEDCLPKRLVAKFCRFLSAHPRIVTLVHHHHHHRHGGKLLRSNLQGEHVVTKDRAAMTLKELDEEPFRKLTVLSQGTMDEFDAIEALVRVECLHVTVASRSWDIKFDLPKLVKDIAVEAGIKPAYAESE